MSRSRPNQVEDKSLPVFGKDFEVGPKVCDCKLAKISVVDKVEKGTPYEQIRLSFIKNNVWITKFISVKPLECYESKKKYDSARTQAWTCIENLMSCYLSSEHMKHVLFNTATHGVKKTMEIIKKALVEKRFWEKPVCLKTVPELNGSVSIAHFAPFMVNQNGPRNYELTYTPWEKDKYKSWLKQKKKNN